VADGDGHAGRQLTARARGVRYARPALAAALLAVVLLGILGASGTLPLIGPWHLTPGPWHSYGTPLAIALELVLLALLVVLRARRRRSPPAGHPAAELHTVLQRMIAVAAIALPVLVLISDVPVSPLRHAHFFPAKLPPQLLRRRHVPVTAIHGGAPSVPVRYILLAILLLAAIVAVGLLLRYRRADEPASQLPPDDDDGTSLRKAVESGRRALAELDDARAAIIACYLAMEQSLGRAGTRRGAAETPDELLARAVTAGLVRGSAAGSLTAQFYEARFSTHQLPDSARDSARQALDAISADLRSAARPTAAHGAPQ
jgi:hypothetical protein